MARLLHKPFVLMALCLTGGSCVVPAAIEGPTDSRPRIVMVLTVPSPEVLQTVPQSGEGEIVTKSFNVAVVDPDPQTLRTRAFVDGRYEEPLPDLVDDAIEPDPNDPGRVRGYIFEIQGLCDERVDFELVTHVLELYVSDEGFVDSGSDLRVPQPGGFRDNVLWRFLCTEPLADVGG